MKSGRTWSVAVGLMLSVVLGACPISRGAAAGEKENARVTLADGERALRVTRVVAAPLGKAYAAWTTSEGFSAAQDTPATIELRRGGKFEVQWRPDQPEGQRGSEGCEVISYLPNRMVSFTWNAPPQFGSLRDERTQVVVEFDEVAPGIVRMTLTHLGWGEGKGWDNLYQYFATAWVAVMNRMAAHLGPAGDKGRDAWVYFIKDPSRPDLMETLTAQEREAFARHVARLRQATKDGQIVMAGPCTDESGPGIVVFYAEDERAARAFMEEEPFFTSAMFKGELHPVRLALLRERDGATRD